MPKDHQNKSIPKDSVQLRIFLPTVTSLLLGMQFGCNNVDKKLLHKNNPLKNLGIQHIPLPFSKGSGIEPEFFNTIEPLEDGEGGGGGATSNVQSMIQLGAPLLTKANIPSERENGTQKQETETATTFPKNLGDAFPGPSTDLALKNKENKPGSVILNENLEPSAKVHTFETEGQRMTIEKTIEVTVEEIIEVIVEKRCTKQKSIAIDGSDHRLGSKSKKGKEPEIQPLNKPILLSITHANQNMHQENFYSPLDNRPTNSDPSKLDERNNQDPTHNLRSHLKQIQQGKNSKGNIP